MKKLLALFLLPLCANAQVLSFSPGSAAYQNIGTSGNVLCLLSNVCTFSGADTFSAGAAASTSSVLVTTAPYTAGTTTTNFPPTYLNATGAAAPTTFSANGTMFGINAPSGFTGNLIYALTNGVGKFTVDYLGQVSGSNLIATGQVKGATLAITTLLCSNTAPTIASGFGTSPSIANNNGTCSFTVNVGTGGTANSGVLTLPAASHGWSCRGEDRTTPASFVESVFSTSTTSVTVNNYSRTTGLAIAWTASDVLEISCFGY